MWRNHVKRDKQRILWVDALKAFAIAIVILGHCLQFTDVNGILYEYITLIQMPLFMAISGYCSYKISMSSENIKKRFCQLVIPFFVWPIVWYMVKMDFSGIADYYILLPLYPDTGLWFLYILFLISLVDFARSKPLLMIDTNQLIGEGKKKLTQYAYEISIIGTTVFLLGVFCIYKRADLSGNWINFVALYYPYYALGCLMRKHNEWLEKHLKLIGSIGMVIYIFGTYFLEARIWQPVLAVSGILGTFLVFRRSCDYKMPQLIMFAGTSTLGIYAVHQPVINYVKHIIETPAWMDVILTFVITNIISLLIVRMLKMSKLTRFLLLGMNR